MDGPGQPGNSAIRRAEGGRQSGRGDALLAGLLRSIVRVGDAARSAEIAGGPAARK